MSRYKFPITSPALFLGGLLWVAAFWLPVFETAEGTITGYWVFATGWMGFAMFQFAWYANLLMLVAVILMYSAPLRATLLAALGLLVATQAFWFDVLPGTASSTAITGQGLGFWAWYAGIFMLGLGVVFGADDVAPDEKPVAEAEAGIEAVITPDEGEAVLVSDEEISAVTQASSVSPSSVVNHGDELPVLKGESSHSVAKHEDVPSAFKHKDPLEDSVAVPKGE